MERYDIYKDIADRTGGDIYIGVGGPVRTGKSTFISRFMDKMVLPKITGKNKKQIAQDEMPQSAEGKTVMTTEPKFVPSESVGINLSSGAARIRLIDCVGYLVEGAVGTMEGDTPRMVKTPWSDEPMSFEKAGEFGTQKVIKEHSTIGVVITSDGTITDIPRENYISAEEKVIGELKAINKPFIVVLNTKNPKSKETEKLRQSLEQKYEITVVSCSVQDADEQDFKEILQKVLFEFPLRLCAVTIPEWMQALPYDSKIISSISSTLKESGKNAYKMKDVFLLENAFSQGEKIYSESVECQLGEGVVELNLQAKPELFYEVLSQECGEEIKDEFSLVSYVKGLTQAKKCYEKIKDALPTVENFGYGIVNPTLDEMEISEPELVRHGGRYGVKINAKAYSYHIMKIGLDSSVSPLVGTKKQCEDFLEYLNGVGEKDKESLLKVNIFGKPLADIVKEEMAGKLGGMPENARNKMKRTITRIVNEGKGGVICILL